MADATETSTTTTAADTSATKDAAYWEAEAKKAFEVRQQAKREADDLRKKLDALNGVDPEEYRALKQKAEEAEIERQRKAGEFDKALQAQAQKFQTERESLAKERDEARQRLNQTVVGRAFADAVDLFGANGKTKYIPSEAEAIFRDHVRVEADGSVVVLDADGDVILDSKTGKPAAFSAAMGEYIESLPDKQYRLRGSGKTGSGSSGGTTAAAGAKQPLDASKLTPEQLRDPNVLAQLRAQRNRGGQISGRAYEQ